MPICAVLLQCDLSRWIPSGARRRFCLIMVLSGIPLIGYHGQMLIEHCPECTWSASVECTHEKGVSSQCSCILLSTLGTRNLHHCVFCGLHGKRHLKSIVVQDIATSSDEQQEDKNKHACGRAPFTVNMKTTRSGFFEDAPPKCGVSSWMFLGRCE